MTVSFVSSIPFLIGAIAYALISQEHHTTDGDVRIYFATVLLQGQLFLVAVSFIATSLHRLWNSPHSYSRPDIISAFSIVLFGVIGVFYGLNPEFARLRSPLSEKMSVAFFILSIVFYYYTAVLSYQRPKKVADALEEDVRTLGNKLHQRRQAEAQGAEQ